MTDTEGGTAATRATRETKAEAIDAALDLLKRRAIAAKRPVRSDEWLAQLLIAVRTLEAMDEQAAQNVPLRKRRQELARVVVRLRRAAGRGATRFIPRLRISEEALRALALVRPDAAADLSASALPANLDNLARRIEVAIALLDYHGSGHPNARRRFFGGTSGPKDDAAMQQMAAACWDLLVGVGQRPSTARNGDLETLCGYVAEASGRRSGDLKRQLLKLRTTLLSRDDAILNDFPSD